MGYDLGKKESTRPANQSLVQKKQESCVREPIQSVLNSSDVMFFRGGKKGLRGNRKTERKVKRGRFGRNIESSFLSQAKRGGKSKVVDRGS